jgi:hypothetical protein
LNSKIRNLIITIAILLVLIIGIIVFVKISHKPIVGLDTVNLSDYEYFVNYDKDGNVGVIDRTGKALSLHNIQMSIFLILPKMYLYALQVKLVK